MIATKENLKDFELILEPIIFLDLFKHPLNTFELYKLIDKKISYLETENILKVLVNNRILQERQGFYFLYGQEGIVAERHKRYNYSRAKLKKANFFTKIFSAFPGVIAVAAANFIGDHNWRLESDIDMFIITKKNYLWLSRLYCAGIAKLSFSRPRKNYKKDKICLSFYISEKNLNLDSLHLQGGDPYFKYWLLGLVPLYSHKNTWDNFIKANSAREQDIDKGLFDKQNKLILPFETFAKKMQLVIMPKALKEAAKLREGVLINDDVLKLYLKEKRPYYRDAYNLKKYEIFKKIN